MTSAFFEKFPPLWDQFERSFKNASIDLILSGALEPFDPRDHALSNVYEKAGWAFWWRGGAGVSWYRQLEAVFFESKYYPLLSKLHKYRELDELVAGNAKEKSGDLGACLTQSNFWGKRDRAEAMYTQILKPCLSARKQELLDGFQMLAQELTRPVAYQLVLPLQDKESRLALEFQIKHKHDKLGVGMDGYQYCYNGRTYQDVASLWQEATQALSKNVLLGKDAYGEGVLKTVTSVPTFDSSDLEWDSQVLEYLFFDGKHIHLVVVRRGYHIASLTFYETLLSADSRMQPLFQQLGWPTSGITWTDAV